MNQPNMQLWIDALLSGEFEQGRSFLKNSCDNKYCCLGVACELYHRETGKGRWQLNNYNQNEFEVEGCVSTAFLPLEVRNWMGMRSRGGNYADDKCLTNDNDNGKTFPEIAQIIRGNVHRL